VVKERLKRRLFAAIIYSGNVVGERDLHWYAALLYVRTLLCLSSRYSGCAWEEEGRKKREAWRARAHGACCDFALRYIYFAHSGYVPAFYCLASMVLRHDIVKTGALLCGNCADIENIRSFYCSSDFNNVTVIHVPVTNR